MRAVDTNVLVYAEISSSRHHGRALEVLTELAEGGRPWALPWPCVYEFLRVVTHARVYNPPVPLARAVSDVRRILASPSLTLLSESERHAEVMAGVLEASQATGNLVHDAHIATLCIEHGVSELLTGDRDFTRFQGLRVVNPFV
jgi:toxin-antitoxin system PIN domain toxin